MLFDNIYITKLSDIHLAQYFLYAQIHLKLSKDNLFY